MATNYSLYSVPAAWVIAIAPHAYAVAVHDSASKLAKFDNTQPRSLTKKIEKDQTLDQATRDLIIRAEGAQQNGFENIGLYAAAILAANWAGIPADKLNLLSGGYLVTRVLYNVVYIKNTSVAVANLRTGIFLTGIGMIFSLFIMAGNRVSGLKQ